MKIFDEWGFEVSARAIAARLANGLIRAVARRAVFRFGVGEKDYWPIHRGTWSQWACLADTDFWRSAEVTIHEPSVAEGEAVAGQFSGVRFHPDDIEAFRQEADVGRADNSLDGPLDVPQQDPPTSPQPTPDSDTQPRTRHGMPALREEILDCWYALFVEAYPDGSKGLAEESARGMFPRHSVDRAKVRKLIGSVPKGRPLKKKE